MTTDNLAAHLYRIGAIQFGEFRLKSGRHSPVYVDLRGLVSHPDVLRSAAETLLRLLQPLEYDLLAGLPYAGLPLAVSVSLLGNMPAIYPRKEGKDYGTRRRVEGVFRPGQRVVVLDDVITTGGAKLELIEPLRDAGLVVENVGVLVDREQGGARTLAEHGLRLHSAYTLRGLVHTLARQGAVSPEQAELVHEYLAREAAAPPEV